MLNEHNEKLADVLLDSLMCDWQDNGNVSADVVRDSCIQALSEVLDVEFDEIVRMVDQLMNEKQ